MRYKIGLTTLSILACVSTTVNSTTLHNQSVNLTNPNKINSCVIGPVKMTSEVEFEYVNLSTNNLIPSNSFSPTDPTSYNLSSSVTIYD